MPATAPTSRGARFHSQGVSLKNAVVADREFLYFGQVRLGKLAERIFLIRVRLGRIYSSAQIRRRVRVDDKKA